MDMIMVKRETGNRLKKLREELGYTQEKFAELLDVSVTLYKKMEYGSYNISVRTMRRLKEITSISVDYLMFGEQKEFDDIWLLLQSAENSTKMKTLLRLIAYFGVDSIECHTGKKQEEEYAEFLDEWMKKIESDSE